MNKIEFLKAAISTYMGHIARAEQTQANLPLYFESGAMKKPEFEARMEQVSELIAMYKEKLSRRQKELDNLTTPKTKCSKCGQAAYGVTHVRDEEGILLAVKYHHEMIPSSGYAWTCTQLMEYETKFNTNGSVKKEMAKRPYAFKGREVLV